MVYKKSNSKKDNNSFELNIKHSSKIIQLKKLSKILEKKNYKKINLHSPQLVKTSQETKLHKVSNRKRSSNKSSILQPKNKPVYTNRQTKNSKGIKKLDEKNIKQLLNLKKKMKNIKLIIDDISNK